MDERERNRKANQTCSFYLPIERWFVSTFFSFHFLMKSRNNYTLQRKKKSLDKWMTKREKNELLVDSRTYFMKTFSFFTIINLLIVILMISTWALHRGKILTSKTVEHVSLLISVLSLARLSCSINNEIITNVGNKKEIYCFISSFNAIAFWLVWLDLTSIETKWIEPMWWLRAGSWFDL